MATAADLLLDAFDRVREDVHDVLGGLSDDQLAARVAPGANTVGWLVWHLTRVADDHVAGAWGEEQVWPAWVERFALPFDDDATGWGQSADDVGQVRVSADLLRGYHDAVQDAVAARVRGVTDADLDRVVDERWDPPVTLGVRLVSVVNDATQHVGQAAYAAGLLVGQGRS